MCIRDSGNHEYRSKKAAQYIKLAKSLGINVLLDESVLYSICGNEIVVSGVNDPLRAAEFEQDVYKRQQRNSTV